MWFATAEHYTDAIRARWTSHNLSKVSRASTRCLVQPVGASLPANTTHLWPFMSLDSQSHWSGQELLVTYHLLNSGDSHSPLSPHQTREKNTSWSGWPSSCCFLLRPQLLVHTQWIKWRSSDQVACYLCYICSVFVSQTWRSLLARACKAPYGILGRHVTCFFN